MEAKKRFFLRDEVITHNDITSAWIVVHGSVIDVTPLFHGDEVAAMSKNLQMLLAFAGKDLSCYFHRHGTPRFRVNQNGTSVHVFVPCVERNKATGCHWWHDPTLVLGTLTAQECTIRIINALTLNVTERTVCCEDTVADIRHRMLPFNDNVAQYEWRKDCAVGNEEGKLNLNKTLSANGFPMGPHSQTPTVWIFYQLPRQRGPVLPAAADDTRPTETVAA